MGKEADLLKAHRADYVQALKEISSDPTSGKTKILRESFGLGTNDTPAFLGMWEACLSVVGGSVAAAESILYGDSLAINLAGGLHHAQYENASGFCMVSDIAIAIKLLRCKFERVAYVDIDLHHGDGPERYFYGDENVLTCSIHQFGRGFYPGTGDKKDHGGYTNINVPMVSGTHGFIWLAAYKACIIQALEAFKPEVIVLQLGVDAHFDDPLGNLKVSVQEWLEAVKAIAEFDVPILALGGGGYEIKNPPRMWPAAVLTLMGETVPEDVPSPMSQQFKIPKFLDSEEAVKAANSGDSSGPYHYADLAAEYIEKELIPNIISR